MVEEVHADVLERVVRHLRGDGAISLQLLHWLLFWEIAAPMLGQKNLALAEAFMF